MAHRGRLNVLANIVGKPYEKIFNEFEGHIDPKSSQGSGDVKYHLGQTGKFTTPDGEHATTVSVVANPSHLEAVDPVLEGIVRAKQDRLDLKLEGYTVLPLLVHGDAAFAGQGVVAETLNLSQLRGLPHRRHRPRGRQQPGRLHHRAGVLAARRSTRPTSPG